MGHTVEEIPVKDIAIAVMGGSLALAERPPIGVPLVALMSKDTSVG